MKYHLATAATLCLLLTILLAQHRAYGQEFTSEEVTSGRLYYNGHDTPAALLSTSAELIITGMLNRTVVTQSFQNTTTQWLEGIYVFPLPEDASVDELEMRIGERIINGVIRTRERAQQVYDEAKQQGRSASLIEQQRANLFTTHVANIPPGGTIDITIAFQSAVRYDDGAFSLTFPLTITPRYVPGSQLSKNTELSESLNTSKPGWATRSYITPPMTGSEQAARTTLSIVLDPGIQVDQVNSESHQIKSTLQDNVWHISLAEADTPMNRDFHLSWQPPAGQSPHAAVFREDKQTPAPASFASVMLLPPQQLFEDKQKPREVVFVIDTSGSMQGSSIIQARKAIGFGIKRLSPQDTFNVIEFDDTASQLFATAVSANDENRIRAVDWVNRLSADGGTEMAAAVELALKNTHAGNDRIRQIVFVTDGSVGNEAEIFQFINSNLGNSRLFTVGIGSAPNTWFMRKAAETGRGSYTLISHVQDVKNKMLLLFNKLERPVITDVNISFNGVAAAEIFPATIPDLYAGEPVLADMRWPTTISSGEIVISGTHAGQPWSRTLTLTPQPHSTAQLSKRFARRKIESLENNQLFDNNPVETEHLITEIALKYGLVSKYTSLIAVEKEIRRNPYSAALRTAHIPSAMPLGNTMNFPNGSLGIAARWAVSLLFSLLAIIFGLATLQQVNSHSDRLKHRS